jgi:hypothetical protein
LTPERSLAWDYAKPHARYFEGVPGALRLGPGAGLQDAPAADASPQRWLKLYRQIFQPLRRRRQARPKEKLPPNRRYLPQSNAAGAVAATR